MFLENLIGGKQTMKHTWTVEISVDDTWVEDGFNLSNPTCRESWLDDNILPHAYSYEKKIKVIKHPDLKKIAKLQGYNSVKSMRMAY